MAAQSSAASENFMAKESRYADPSIGSIRRDPRGKPKPRAKHVAKANTELRSFRSLRGLRRDELPVDTTELARFLVGKILVREVRRGSAVTRMAGRIVETEAYPIGDAAGHHFRGERPRTRILFGPPGHAYVFFNYGSAWMMNVSSEIDGVGGGVLIRALEPLEGIEQMMRNRGVTRLLDVARGPGRLAAAMQIDRSLEGIDLFTGGGAIWLADDGAPPRPIGVTTRIGLSREAHRKLRFYELGSPFVSGPKNLLKGFRQAKKAKTRSEKPRSGELHGAEGSVRSVISKVSPVIPFAGLFKKSAV
jgi:DNA-3-methyladenine glycosylase